MRCAGLAGPEYGGRDPPDRLSEATFYRWWQELAGLKNERAKRGSKISSLKTVGCAGQCLI